MKLNSLAVATALLFSSCEAINTLDGTLTLTGELSFFSDSECTTPLTTAEWEITYCDQNIRALEDAYKQAGYGANSLDRTDGDGICQYKFVGDCHDDVQCKCPDLTTLFGQTPGAVACTAIPNTNGDVVGYVNSEGVECEAKGGNQECNDGQNGRDCTCCRAEENACDDACEDDLKNVNVKEGGTPTTEKGKALLACMCSKCVVVDDESVKLRCDNNNAATTIKAGLAATILAVFVTSKNVC